MNTAQLEESVIEGGIKSMEIINYFLDDKEVDPAKLRQANVVLGFAVKTHAQQRSREMQQRNQAIRLVGFMVKENRDRFIADMLPETRPYLAPPPPREAGRTDAEAGSAQDQEVQE